MTIGQDNALELSPHEQEAYLRYLISRLEAPRTKHDLLLAKAYNEILTCLRKKAANSEDVFRPRVQLDVAEDEDLFR
jgi:hypothetical protein